MSKFGKISIGKYSGLIDKYDTKELQQKIDEFFVTAKMIGYEVVVEYINESDDINIYLRKEKSLYIFIYIKKQGVYFQHYLENGNDEYSKMFETIEQALSSKLLDVQFEKLKMIL